MTNLDSIFKSRDITLPTKVRLVKAMVFPVVMYGCEPMALALGEGSELYAAVGQSIAGGLMTSTLITLFIVPVIYYIGEKNILKRKKRRMERSDAK